MINIDELTIGQIKEPQSLAWIKMADKLIELLEQAI